MANTKLDTYLKRFKEGDEQAFDKLYEATKTAVYYTILSILKDPSLSEDIMQETYIKMIKEMDNYQAKGQFLPWIKTMAYRLAINEYNRNKRHTSVDINESEYLFEGVYGQSEDTYYLQELLKVLPEDEKEIVVRHVILEEKHKDIAAQLDLPLGTVLWKYQKALKTLKKAGE